MDGLANIFSKVLPVASAGAGVVGNLLGQHEQNAYTQQQTAYQKYLQDLAKNPAALSAMVNKATLPLSGALIQGINNSVQGDLASRGLSQAPGIFAATESQALAPYLLSQQDQARQQVLQSLGLGQGQQPGAQFPQPQNMTLALQQALQSIKGASPQPTGGGSNQGGGLANYPYGQPIPTWGGQAPTEEIPLPTEIPQQQGAF